MRDYNILRDALAYVTKPLYNRKTEGVPLRNGISFVSVKKGYRIKTLYHVKDTRFDGIFKTQYSPILSSMARSALNLIN